MVFRRAAPADCGLSRLRTFCFLLRQGWPTGLVPTFACTPPISANECRHYAWRTVPRSSAPASPFSDLSKPRLRSIDFSLPSTFPTLPDVLYLCPILDPTYLYSKIDIYDMVIFLYDQPCYSHQLRPRFRTPILVDARIRAYTSQMRPRVIE